jgi:hypothetical protein
MVYYPLKIFFYEEVGVALANSYWNVGGGAVRLFNGPV